MQFEKIEEKREEELEIPTIVRSLIKKFNEDDSSLSRSEYEMLSNYFSSRAFELGGEKKDSSKAEYIDNNEDKLVN